MKFKNPLLVVTDLDKTKEFYQKVLGLHVILDFGTNNTLTGGISMQTKESYANFIEKNEQDIYFQGNDAELYFEEEQFNEFLEKLAKIEGISYVHSVKEHSWGQRVIRIYDPDGHIIEIGEPIKMVCKRFLENGLSIEETAKRMDVPIKFVKACEKLKKRG